MLSLGPSFCVSLRWLSEESLFRFCSRFSHLENFCFFTCGFVSGSHVFGVSVLHRGTCSASVRDALVRIAHIFLRWCGPQSCCVVSALTQNGEVCSANASVFSPARVRALANLNFFFEFHVAGSCDDGADFLGHLCQTQVPGSASTPGVRLPGGPAHGA